MAIPKILEGPSFFAAEGTSVWDTLDPVGLCELFALDGDALGFVDLYAPSPP